MNKGNKGSNGKKAETKPAGEKKARKARAVIRDRATNPAGHFADRLQNYDKQANDVMSRIEKWPGIAEAVTTAEICAVLETLDASGFQPPKRTPGAKKVVFSAGDRVVFKSEAAAMIGRDMPEFANGAEFFVGFSYDPATDGENIPVRANDATTGAPLGRYSRKLLAPFQASA